MKEKLRRFLLFIAILTIGLFAFYKFMTFDRNYVWVKEFNEEVSSTMANSDYKITGTKDIETEHIKLPLPKSIQLTCQKALSVFGLMNYGQEFGQVISLDSDDKKELTFKAWCLGDYVIGLEIEYKNLNDSTLNNLKRDVGQHFSNYSIIWTKM